MEPPHSGDTHAGRAPWCSLLTSYTSQIQFLEEAMSPKTKLGKKCSVHVTNVDLEPGR